MDDNKKRRDADFLLFSRVERCVISDRTRFARCLSRGLICRVSRTGIKNTESDAIGDESGYSSEYLFIVGRIIFRNELTELFVRSGS